VSFKAPHVQDDAEETEPFQPHPRHLAVHATTVFPRPVTATAGHFERLPAFLRDSEARRRWQTRFGTEERRQESLRRYYALVTGVDAALGEILATLDATGRGEDTVVVFTSDNGFFLGEHGLAGKWYGFDESIRTPLLIAPAAASASADVHLPTLNIDLAPTLIDLAGLPIPERMQGRSLRPLLTGERPAPSWRRDWLYEHRLVLPKKLGLDTGLRDISKSEGIRSERYKYLVHYDEPEPNVLLFDLQADPHEEWNLASTADPKLLATLEDRLVELRAQAASD
jgi:arylsulfatase A-like enzyme